MIGCLEVGLGYVLLLRLRWQQEDGLLMTACLLCMAYLLCGFNVLTHVLRKLLGFKLLKSVLCFSYCCQMPLL